MYFTNKPGSSYFYVNESIDKAINLNDKSDLILAYARIGAYFWQSAKYSASLQILLKGISLCQQENFPGYLSLLYQNIAWVYVNIGQYNQALNNLRRAVLYFPASFDPFYNIPVQTYITYSWAYLFMGNPDSASYSLNKVNDLILDRIDPVSYDQYLGSMAALLTDLKQYERATQVCLKAIETFKKNNDNQTLDYTYAQYATILLKNQKFREAIPQAKLSLNTAQVINDKMCIVIASKIISDCYDSLGNTDSTLYFLKLNVSYYADLVNARNVS